MAYAEKTSVSVSKTKADIEDMVQRYGAVQFVSGYKGDIAVIGICDCCKKEAPDNVLRRG